MGDRTTGIIGTGDFNGDGWVDVAYSRGGGFQWYAGPEFDGDEEYDIGPGSGNSYGGTVADMNGDGWPDLVASDGAAGSGPGSLWVFVHPGQAALATEPWERITIYTLDVWHQNDLQVADLDGDDRLDVVVRTRSDERRLVVALQNPDFENWTVRAWPTGETSNGPEGLSLGDIDSDGVPEIVLSGVYWSNPGGWRTGEPEEYLFDADFVGKAVKSVVADLDGDGQADDVAMSKAEGGGSDGTVSWYVHDGFPQAGPSAWSETVLLDQVTNVHTLEVADFDLDGALDLLAGRSFGQSGLYVFYGSTDGTPWEQQLISPDDRMYVASVNDLDGDGDLDFVGPKKWQGAVVWHENLLFDGGVTEPPAAPSQLMGSALSSTRIGLTWIDNASNESRFEVERRSSGGTFERVGTPPLDSEAYLDTGLEPSTSYDYRVRAVNGAGPSDYTSVVEVTTLEPDVTPPTVPTGLRVLDLGPSWIQLAWDASSDDQAVAGYRLYRDDVFVLEVAGLEATVTGLSPNTLYAFQVSALDTSENESARSDPTSACTDPAADLSEEVVAHWALDAESGSLAADSQGAHDGTLSGGTSWIPGQGALGGALEMDGSGRVSLGAFDPGEDWEELTLAAWVQPCSFVGSAAEARFLSKASGTAGNDHVWMLGNYSGGSALRFRLETSGSGVTTLLSSADQLQLDSWVHVAATYDGQLLRLFRDGIEIAATPASGTIPKAAGVSAALGNQPAGAGERGFEGLLDDVWVLKRALDPAELAALAAGDLFADGGPFSVACICADAPCGNSDDLGGCQRNGSVGARLFATGSGSISADDLVLQMTHATPSQSGLVFMGSEMEPLAFGNGLRCVGGFTVRWPVRSTDAQGNLSYGPGLVGQVGLLSGGLFEVLPGTTRVFQGWYRDPGGACGASFNTSSAIIVGFVR